MKKSILFTLTVILSLSINAQNGIIKGKIIDANQAPQEFTNILLLNPSDSALIKGVVTNYEGDFTFEKLEKGSYLVKASMVGFDNVYSSVIQANNDVTSLPALTLLEGLALSEVTVTAKKAFIEMKADKIVVNVANSAVNAGNSALEVLQKSPGVTVDKDNNISLRGKQGVLVMINGKNQYMTGDELSRMLESMPAENINSIEIITNPSSKYDAEGNSGIINIKMKKNENLGYNGSVNAGFRQGYRSNYNTGLDLNYRSSKINVFGSGSIYDWAGFQDLELSRVIPFDGGNTNFDQMSEMLFDGRSYNAKIGVDYSLSDKTTIGVLYKLNSGGKLWKNDNMTNITGSNAPAFSQLSVLGVQDGNWAQNSYNFNVVHNFDDNGTSLSFDTDYSLYGSGSDNTYDNTYSDDNGAPVLAPFMLRNFENTDIEIIASKLDFTKTFDQGYNFELGAKLSMVSTDNNTKFEALENEAWVNQTARTNNFIYKENVVATYANLSKTFGKVNVQAGLRMEHTKSEGLSITLDESVPREYTDWFPSLSVSHKVGEKHSLSYSYSKRLNRPSYQDLNPFIEYLDDYTFAKGNPFLSPQYSNAFGLNYGYGGFIFLSANYSRTKDAITQVIEQLSEQNQTFQTNVNLDAYNAASLTLSTSIPWKEIGVSRINITSFYNDFQSDIPSGTLDNQNLAYNIYLGNEFNLPAEIIFELSANYRSGLTYGLFQISPQFGVDLGFSKDILNGKGNIKIGLDDIFYTRNESVTIRQDDINLDIAQKRDSRRVKLNFKYKFGNNKVKSARRRATATSDENSRIKSDN